LNGDKLKLLGSPQVQ